MLAVLVVILSIISPILGFSIGVPSLGFAFATLGIEIYSILLDRKIKKLKKPLLKDLDLFKNDIDDYQKYLDDLLEQDLKEIERLESELEKTLVNLTSDLSNLFKAVGWDTTELDRIAKKVTAIDAQVAASSVTTNLENPNNLPVAPKHQAATKQDKPSSPADDEELTNQPTGE